MLVILERVEYIKKQSYYNIQLMLIQCNGLNARTIKSKIRNKNQHSNNNNNNN